MGRTGASARARDEDRVRLKVPNARTRAAMEELKRGKAKRFATVDAVLADLSELFG